MMFDNSLADSPSRWEGAKQHLPFAVVALAAVGVAAGLHLASAALAAVAVAHLVLGGVVLAARGLRSGGTSGEGR